MAMFGLAMMYMCFKNKPTKWFVQFETEEFLLCIAMQNEETHDCQCVLRMIVFAILGVFLYHT